MRPIRATLALAALAPLALVAGCAPADVPANTTTASQNASSAAACSKDSLDLTSPGVFTVGTDNPAYEPWFSDNTPSNGKGFESAMAYAVAEKLGFDRAAVKWVTVSFNAAIAPGPKSFDVDINQISINDERKKAVDFSTGYYDVTQALVTVKGSKIAGAKTIAALAGAKIGAQVGTTSYKTVTDVIKPKSKPAVFNTNDDAKLALSNGQIDGLVVDLPTALYMASADLKDGVLVGQFAQAPGTPEQFGLVLDKGSSLTTCVSQAVDALRNDGTLAQLQQQWLTTAAGAPVLS